MDFELSEEQSLLRESVRRLVAAECGFAQRRAHAALPEGFSREVWGALAGMGLLGLPFAEAHGGSAASPVETMIVMEELGRGPVLSPYLSSVVLAGGLVAEAGSAAQQAAILPDLIAGRSLLAFAHGEPQSRYDAREVETRARGQGDGYVLDGRKSVVLHGDSADRLIVAARTGGGARDEAGLTLFLVPRDAAGLTMRATPTIDDGRCAELALDGVRVAADTVLGPAGGAWPFIERALDRATAAVAAEAVGAMAALLDLTVDYAKTRRQFGAAIGSFQALQHRLVDMRIAWEQAMSMACVAALRVDAEDADLRRRALSAAKVQIDRSARFIGQQAIQLHGGIGMTDEYAAGHYFKRLTAIASLFGDVDFHIGRFVAAGVSEE